MVISGWTHEHGRVRSLLLGVHRDGKLTYVAASARAFGAEVEKTLRQQFAPSRANESPSAGPDAPRKEANVNWARPEARGGNRVRRMDRTPAMVRQAAFKGLREDKPASEVKIEVAAPPPNETGAKKRRKLESQLAPDRPPKPRHHSRQRLPERTGRHHLEARQATVARRRQWQAVTKLDLASYYEAVGDWMIEHLRAGPAPSCARPTASTASVLPAPRDAGNVQALHARKCRGDQEPYVQIDRVEALARVAQIGALELHPWNCLPGDPECPADWSSTSIPRPM